MRIQHNIMAMNSYRNYSGNTGALAKNLEKLSSGYRINRAGDDAAGLAISEKMRAQISGLEQAQSNAKSGINLVQTAEGSLTEVHSMLNRMVTLTNQSANGTYDNETDRANLQKEVAQLTSEIDRIADSSNFNGIKLLDGSLGNGTSGGTAKNTGGTGVAAGAIDFTVSGSAGLTVTFGSKVSATKSASAAWSGSTLTITLGSGTSADTFTQADIDAAIAGASGAPTLASGMKVTLNKDIVTTTTPTDAAGFAGASVATAEANKATATYANTGNTAINVTANKAGANTSTLTFAVADANNGAGTAAVASGGDTTVYIDTNKSYTASELNNILEKAGAGMSVSFEGSSKVAAGSASALSGGTGLASGGGLTLQIGDTAESFNQMTVSVGDMHAKSLGIGGIDISTQAGASSAIEKLKNAINSVSSTRGTLGALQNRLDHTINNLGVMTENIQDAESTVRDVDVAKEMMAYTKNNILVQSAQAMLAQANQVPQGVLQLLQ